MEREISSGAMLGIVLLALAAVIGLGFGVFAIAKGVANEGTVNVQDSLGTVSSQVFLDYDQKIITGTQASSALKNFEGKPYAVVIATKALANGQKIASATDHPAGYVVSDGTRNFLNYNAVLSSSASGTATGTVTGGNAVPTTANTTSTYAQLDMKNGTYVVSDGFAVSANGSIVFDNATGGTSKSGNAEYIPNSTKFQANVIKDSSGAYVGIVLRQI